MIGAERTLRRVLGYVKLAAGFRGVFRIGNAARGAKKTRFVSPKPLPSGKTAARVTRA
jgi:hypothetical protein